MPEQAVVVELAEGLEPNILPLPHHFEDAVHLQSVGGVCGAVRVANILLEQPVLIGVFVKGLQRGDRWDKYHGTGFTMSDRPIHART